MLNNLTTKGTKNTKKKEFKIFVSFVVKYKTRHNPWALNG